MGSFQLNFYKTKHLIRQLMTLSADLSVYVPVSSPVRNDTGIFTGSKLLAKHNQFSLYKKTLNPPLIFFYLRAANYIMKKKHLPRTRVLGTARHFQRHDVDIFNLTPGQLLPCQVKLQSFHFRRCKECTLSPLSLSSNDNIESRIYLWLSMTYLVYSSLYAGLKGLRVSWAGLMENYLELKWRLSLHCF